MEKVKEAGRQITAGGSAGLVEVCIMHPLDLVKTRLQLPGGHFNGLMDCFRKTLKSEGVSGFYKGILPPILAETPKRATKFFTFEQYKRAFVADSIPAWFSLSMAGLCSGLTEAVIVCPFEVVKVRLQAEHGVTMAQQKSTATIAREIIKEHGWGSRGIFLGLDATLARNGTWNMFYFGIYHSMKDFIPRSIASFANIPFDVGKSRIQGPQPASGRIYFNVIQSMKLVAEKEGIKALYRGFLPKVMRLGPGGAIMLFVYESVYDFLKLHT